jgi:hypothetical protein
MSDSIDGVMTWAENHKPVAIGAVGVTLFGLLFLGWRRHAANAAGATNGATAATVGSSFTSTPYSASGSGADASGLTDSINTLGGTLTTAIGGLDIPGQTAATSAGFTGLTDATNQGFGGLTDAVTGLTTFLGNTNPTTGGAGSGATTGATATPKPVAPKPVAPKPNYNAQYAALGKLYGHPIDAAYLKGQTNGHPIDAAYLNGIIAAPPKRLGGLTRKT